MKGINNRPRPQSKGRFLTYLPQHKLKNQVMKVTKRERQLIMLARLDQDES